MKALELAVPKPVKIITAGVDFQIDRCEVEFVGWDEGEETWGLGHEKIYGDFSVLERKGEPWIYHSLERLLQRLFVREDGATLRVMAAGFDSGFAGSNAAHQRAVYSFVRPRLSRRYFATKGSSGKWDPLVRQGRRHEKVTLFIVGTNRAKDIWYRRSTIGVAGPGYMHIPKTDDYNEEWFKQFLAEDSHTERHGGVEMRIFKMPAVPKEDGSAHNEALDCRVENLVAFTLLGSINWAAEEKRNLATIPPPGAKRGTPPPKEKRQRKQSQWLNWR